MELLEGLPAYGPPLVFLDLTLSNAGPENFPNANKQGKLVYTETISVSELQARLGISDLSMLDKFAVVLHGANVGGMYWASLPVACAQIEMR